MGLVRLTAWRYSLPMNDEALAISDETVAARVRAELTRKKVSQAQLARQLHVTDMYLCRRLKADVPFGAVELVAVAEALDVPVEELLAGAA